MDPARLRPAIRRDLLVLGLLVTIYLVLQWRFLEQPLIYDPIEYFLSASKMPHNAVHHRSLRIGLLGPVRLGIEVFGYSQAAYYLVPVASGVTLLMSTYVLGRVLVSRSVGAGAALLVVVNTHVFADSSQIYPDLPAAALFTAGCAVLAVVGSRSREEGSGAVAALTIAAGLLFGWSYLIREFVVVLFPLVPVLFWAFRIPWRYLLHVAGSALAMLGVELAYGALVHGDPLVRMHELLGSDGPPPEHVEDLIASRQRARGSRLERVALLVTLLRRAPAGAIFVGLAALLVAGSVVRRDRRLIALLLWAGGYWVTLTTMSLIEDQYGQTVLFTNKIRYWYPILPPLVIGGLAAVGVFVATVADRIRWSGRNLAGATVLLVAVAGAALTVRSLEARSSTLDGSVREYDELRDWLRTEGAAEDVLWTTQRTSWIVEMYTHGPFGRTLWDGEVRAINTARRFVGPARVTDGWFVLNEDFFAPRYSNWRDATPRYLVDPPPTWQVAEVTDDSELVVYHVGGRESARNLGTVGTVSNPWTLRQGDGSSVAVATGTIEVQDRSRQLYSHGPWAGDGTLPPGAALRGEVELGAAGAGDAVLWCFFRGDDGTSRRVRAVTAWGVPFETGQVEFVCEPPRGLVGPIAARVLLIVDGPLTLTLGELQVDAVAGG